MITLSLIGIGTGNPDHLTRQAMRALNGADLILIPRKGAGKADLAELRRAIVAEVVSNPTTRIAEFDLPTRDAATADYRRRVDDWHEAIATVWTETIDRHLGPAGKVALLVWGDPSLYDSTLRIAARLSPAPQIEVIPGITSIQALTAAHAIPLNEINGPVVITTGRRLRDEGFPPGTDTCVVMLDGECSFQHLPPEGLSIWWAGFAGMPEQITESGPLAEATPRILARRAAARAVQGWIMDIYLLRRQ
ncbi:precorrin-6A synthase (deacetylating) [Gemmobacter aquatilis]|uniref:Precorrin-6A synthase [deacetylating] n=1 Tax=Gemmobacter aquatilis TaxID=933059 RepID=A0A1H8FI28_9RHOB|nr:precorrin-6A synthase (deacetylating) [Gemmobacter aquatilis]SEN31164.1 precorrin-6A synthase (deacetylating) [Gemmobacter aquatilis]